MIADTTVTPEKVRDFVEDIRASAHDPEAAHYMEDAAYEAVLEAISEGRCVEPVECARLVLTARDIDFPRWCA